MKFRVMVVTSVLILAVIITASVLAQDCNLTEGVTTANCPGSTGGTGTIDLSGGGLTLTGNTTGGTGTVDASGGGLTLGGNTNTGGTGMIDASGGTITGTNTSGVVNTGNGDTTSNADIITSIEIDNNSRTCAAVSSINAFDCQAPVVLYDNPLQVWAIHSETGDGTFAFGITEEQINAAGIPESGTVLIAQGTHPDTGLPIAIYRHADGGFQVNAFFADMKSYVGIWQRYGGFTNLSGEQN
jgi:hypothetical protein